MSWLGVPQVGSLDRKEAVPRPRSLPMQMSQASHPFGRTIRVRLNLVSRDYPLGVDQVCHKWARCLGKVPLSPLSGLGCLLQYHH